MQFFAFQPTNFVNNTIILPALSVGNIGQLTIDLLISTFSFEKVGYLESKFVLCVTGNGAHHDPKDLVTNLEVYQKKDSNITLLQQRGPIIKKNSKSFSQSLINWIQNNNFQHIILLESAEASFRLDTQITGSQLRFISTKTINNQLSWLHLEKESFDVFVRRETFTSTFFDDCQTKGLDLLVLVLFCSEGNNIPESIIMATNIINFFHLKKSTDSLNSFTWVFPNSWNTIEGTAISLQNTMFK